MTHGRILRRRHAQASLLLPASADPHSRGIGVALLLAASGLALSGCGRRETPVTEGLRTQTLHVGNAIEPQGLDPQTTTGSNDHSIQLALLEGLLVPDPVTGQPAAGGATSWEISPDLLVYTFHLRANALWSDGQPVTAEDYVGSARRALSPKLGAEAGNSFIWLAGARAYLEGKTADFSTVGIRALDTLTVEVRLEEPVPFLLHSIVSASWAPVPLHVLKRHGNPEDRLNPWTRPGNFVGNGPFVLKEWRPNRFIIVEKSPTYWDRDRVRLHRIVFYPIDDIDAEEKMFRTGQLHMTATLPAARMAHWRAEQPEALRIEPQQRLTFVTINPTRAPFTDVRVRRAFALAIEREPLARIVTGQPPPARSFAPPNGVDFEPKPHIEDSAQTAQRLLAEAGFPGGRGFPPVELLLANRGENKMIAEVLQEMWRKHLGVTVTLSIQDWAVYIDTQNAGRHQLAMDGWTMAHPYEFYDLHRTGNTLSRYLWSNADFDQLLRAARSAATIPARNDAYDRLETLLAREMPIIPLVFPVTTLLLHPAVSGFHSNAQSQHPWKYFHLDPAVREGDANHLEAKSSVPSSKSMN